MKWGFLFLKIIFEFYNFFVGICKCVFNMVVIFRDKIFVIGLIVIYEFEGEVNLE